MIPTEKRMTHVCLHRLGVHFPAICATGYMDRKRNLDFDEIVDEVTLLMNCRKHYNKKLSTLSLWAWGAVAQL